MHKHIPFVETKTDCDLAQTIFRDSPIFRVSLHASRAIQRMSGGAWPLWVDPGFDGFHHIAVGKQSFVKYRKLREDARERGVSMPRPIDWVESMQKYGWHARLADQEFILKPDKKVVRKIVDELMDACAELHAAWISVPQLPLANDSGRNRFNRTLAEEAGNWRQRRRYGGKLILPVIFSHKSQTKGKTKWKPRVETAAKCFQDSAAAGAWLVDTDLDEFNSWSMLDQRLKCLIDVHAHVRSMLGSQSIIVAGPYFGFNLVLWARGDCDYPAIGTGGASRYWIPGMMSSPPKTRIALDPLRRVAISGPALRSWLRDATGKLDKSEKAYQFFRSLYERWSTASQDDEARRGIAVFYKSWIDEIEAVPPQGRAVALFQDLSKAYVLGSILPDLPYDKAARKPGGLSQILMLNCL